MDKAAFMNFTIGSVRTLYGCQGFTVQPRRWVVGRTFGSLIRWRRLERDHEQHIDISQKMIYLAMGSTLLQWIFSAKLLNWLGSGVANQARINVSFGVSLK